MNAVRGLRLWALLTISPWLLGARGCIEELSVGVERGEQVPDAAQVLDGGPVDGGLPSCAARACGETRPESRLCDDGNAVEAHCAPSGERCAWVLPECPPPSDGGPNGGPCRPDDCEFIISFETSSLLDEFGCADGTEPSCVRNESGYCSYRCPEEVSCSLARDTCPPGSFCVFSLGTCGRNEEVAFCQARSSACPELDAPVCGCDGVTYANTCKAFQAGVSVSFNGRCDEKVTLCDACPTVSFSQPAGELCQDGRHRAGPTCVQKPKGGCAYQWLACPSEECEPSWQSLAAAGECWSDDDCAPGQQCLEVSICPCNATCLSADRPGHCG